MKFLNLLALIAKGNELFYESQENKRNIYAFILTFFDSFIKREEVDFEQVHNILKYLLDIALEADRNAGGAATKFFICEPSAMETYFQILVKCFKSLPAQSNRHLQHCVLSPLDTLNKSLVNCCSLSKMLMQVLLMKILKRAEEAEFQRHVSEHIGRISSVHTTSEHIQSLMRHFAKSSKHVAENLKERYYLILLDTLIDSISGDSVRAMYYFAGHEESFIKLRTPLHSSGGLFWTGSIRYESKDYSRKQCILSFINTQYNESRGIELYLYEKRLHYHLVYLYKGDHTERLEVPGLTLLEDTWYHIVMFHTGNEVQIYVNFAFFTLQPRSQTFPREYNHAAIGAAIDPESGRHHSFFFGEMSTLYFFTPSTKFKDTVKDLATRGRYLASLYKIESSLTSPLPSSWREANPEAPKYMNREFLAATHFVLNPKVVLSNTVAQRLRQGNERRLSRETPRCGVAAED